MNQSIIYTKAIKDGRLNTTGMEVGSTFNGTITGTLEGKFGPALKVKIGNNPKATIINVSGNLKFVVKDYLAGKYGENPTIQATRIGDVEFKGYATTQFEVLVNGELVGKKNNNVASTNSTNVDSTASSVSDKLAAIRAKRATPANS